MKERLRAKTALWYKFMDYYTLFEQLTDQMTNLEAFDVPGIFATLAEICRILRVSKGVTTYYRSPHMEQLGKGEDFVCYDNGAEHVLVSPMRIVTPAQVVIVCNVYQKKGDAPFTEEERRRVEIIQRMMLTYMDKARQKEVINNLMYYGEDGFHNLRFFYVEIARLIKAGQLAGKTTMRINLHRFTLVNEQIGIEAGDRVMLRYCKALEEAWHNSGILCRLGGDNFVAVFDSKYLPEVLNCLNGIPIPWDESEKLRVEISAVAGIYCVESKDENHDPGAVMGKIVNAYLIAKREYTPDIVYYSDEFQLEKAKELKVQAEFRQAIRDQDFLVYYQPKVDVITRELIGAEALCRWQREGRLIPPLEFIPTLERGSDICDLDFYMLEHVCMDIRRWLENGLDPVPVSVNFSRRHLIDPDLFANIISIVDRHQVPHKLIEIELTETTTDVEFKDLKRVVSQLQQAGFSTSVDDFGIGYSSLNLIKQIPWNVLKLDKSILPEKGEDQNRGRSMFGHIIAMAHEIGLNCVAEGVETEDQLEFMKRSGCRIAQGFYFDKPLPVDEFESRLLKKVYS